MLWVLCAGTLISQCGDDMDQNRETSGFSLGTWLLHLLLILLAITVGLIIYFIVPKLESNWAAQGMRPPVWASALIALSHGVVKYWYLIVVALFVFPWLQRQGSSSPRE